MRRAWSAPVAAACLVTPLPAGTMPTIDTEDASLGEAEVGDGRFHPLLGVDLRNGDFARGSYDDDAASLARLPAHLQLGFGYELHRRVDGTPDAWLVATSSNGLHAPAGYETARPRAWYESNNLVGVVVEPTHGLRLGVAYTIKTSPNAVSDTTHEASVTAAYDGKHGLGALHPNFAATVRPVGDGGAYTQIGIAPGLALGRGDDAPKLSLPLTLGVGWGGFYGPGSGDRVYGSAGLALAQPFALGALHATARLQAAALIRDDRLRALSAPRGGTGTVVPLVTAALSFAY